jgi:hypothetical protein
VDEIHDTSRLDAFMAARRRATVLNALWKPMLAGGLASLAVSAAIWVVLPKISYREIVVPRVAMRDVTVPNIVQRDVQVDHVVPRETIIEIPRIVSVTPTEKRFLDSPEFAAAPMRGRIVQPRHDGALSFDDGQDYAPTDPGKAADSGPFIGLWGYCAPTADKTIFHCFALLRDGTVVPVPQKPAGRPT